VNVGAVNAPQLAALLDTLPAAAAASRENQRHVAHRWAEGGIALPASQTVGVPTGSMACMPSAGRQLAACMPFGMYRALTAGRNSEPALQYLGTDAAALHTKATRQGRCFIGGSPADSLEAHNNSGSIPSRALSFKDR
jgi:hypothetical protein